MDEQKKKILVVDDDQFFLKLIRDVLTHHGYEVEIAEDGKKGFSMAITGDYDLITLDLRMPELNGIESLRSIKTVNPEQKIIVISGFISDDIREELQFEQIDAILTKPINLSDFFETVKAAME